MSVRVCEAAHAHRSCFPPCPTHPSTNGCPPPRRTAPGTAGSPATVAAGTGAPPLADSLRTPPLILPGAPADLYMPPGPRWEAEAPHLFSTSYSIAMSPVGGSPCSSPPPGPLAGFSGSGDAASGMAAGELPTQSSWPGPHGAAPGEGPFMFSTLAPAAHHSPPPAWPAYQRPLQPPGSGGGGGKGHGRPGRTISATAGDPGQGRRLTGAVRKEPPPQGDAAEPAGQRLRVSYNPCLARAGPAQGTGGSGGAGCDEDGSLDADGHNASLGAPPSQSFTPPGSSSNTGLLDMDCLGVGAGWASAAAADAPNTPWKAA
jgi:hypothetical protein